MTEYEFNAFLGILASVFAAIVLTLAYCKKRG